MRSAAAALMVWMVLGAFAGADVVHLKNGARLTGTIKSQDDAGVVMATRFGEQRIARADIARIERGATPREQLQAEVAALDPKDAEGHYQAALRAKELGLKKLHDQLLGQAALIDPLHEGAATALGRVRYKGAFVTPEERDRLEREERARELLAQGLVEHEGRFVTPEEKQKLEQGLVLRDGEWIEQDEARRRDGFVKVGTQWVRGEEHAVDEFEADAEKATGVALTVRKSAHVAIYADVEGDFGAKCAELLEKGYLAFSKEFNTGQGLDWIGGRRIDVFVFRLRFQYEKFVAYLGSERGMGADWADRARRVVSVYRYSPHGIAATYMANKGERFTAAHCANMLGHILINRIKGEGQTLPPFFDEAFAALMEFDLLGRNVVFSLGSGKYAKTLGEDEHQFFEDGLWADSLREAMRILADTPLEQAVRREHATLLQMDVAKGMALYKRWRGQGDDRLKVFFETLRDRWPAGDPPPTHPRVLEAVTHAFHAVEGKDIQVVDQELRRFAMQELK